ncbi:MAG: ABC transporter permease, partial [Propionibacteriaceae bacterium]|nr:ABC transporter permease [Propionibacteriaceae bacterium]
MVIAVAISVGFMVAASGITATMQETTALQKTAYLSKSDVSFTIANPDGPAADSEQLSRELKSIDSVTGAEFLKAFPDATDFAGHSEFVNYFALPSEQFRWSTLTAGSWPANADEIVLGKTAVEAFRAKIGDLVTLTGIGKDFKLVGVSDDIVSMNTQTGYVTPQS